MGYSYESEKRRSLQCFTIFGDLQNLLVYTIYLHTVQTSKTQVKVANFVAAMKMNVHTDSKICVLQRSFDTCLPFYFICQFREIIQEITRCVDISRKVAKKLCKFSDMILEFLKLFFPFELSLNPLRSFLTSFASPEFHDLGFARGRI